MVKIIQSAVDTIELSIKGQLSEDYLDLVNDLKEEAKIEKSPKEIYLPYETCDERLFERFVVLPNGGKMYPYILKGERFELKLTPSQSIPSVSARIWSVILYEIGIEEALHDLGAIIIQLGDFERPMVKRFDLCTDFQGWSPGFEDRERFSSRAKGKTIHYDEDLETFSFGKAPMMLRLYNKSKQIKKKNIEWLKEVWAKNPQYEAIEDTWRLEIELGRARLKRLGIDTPADALGALKGIWDYGLHWTELKSDTTNKQKSRRPVDPRWETLREDATFSGTPTLGLLKIQHKADRRVLLRGFGGYFSSLGASYGCNDPEKVFKWAFDEHERMLSRQFRSFQGEVERKIKAQPKEPQRRTH